MALTLQTTLHMRNGQALSVVETIAQVVSACPANLVFPAGVAMLLAVQLTVANGSKVWVSLSAVDWMEPK